MKLVCCCLSQVINNLFHLLTTLRCSKHRSGLPAQHTHAQPTQHTHTHPPKKRGKGKIEKEEKRRRGGREPAPHHTPHHKTSTYNPSSYHAPHRHHTQSEREKREREKGVPLCVVLIRCVI